MAPKRAVIRQSLPDVIVTDLRKRILSGELEEGALIRQELLAEEYDVSRMPVREALKRLDAEGLVVFKNNRGATVTKHSLEEIAEIFDVRLLLEVDLFARAIPNMTAEDFSACESLLKEMDDSYLAGNIADWGPLNAEYHGKLYQAAGRHLTENLLERVTLQANRYVSMHIGKLDKQHHASHDHHALLALARQRDIEGATALLESHLMNTKLQVIDWIQHDRDPHN
ncbi:GntR family transcriptional regulator [Marinomonas posidonica]|uniref:Transcriptional regulator, GntR family n=1 Tax=Marinomonas posidonica (strain CECT 7376 / NCIMB 14433 / IVIA-Po-181) TaxID=491952 RepID=F6CYY1_MARPP|nr:GntR family transcriptional regulator [Marinomonas posidonica]AEF53108.1 transcriptional regulator, GntR family [Marinomonas posidonica IVIA-Po-181]